MATVSGRITSQLVAGLLLITVATGAQAQDCSSPNIRCVPPITGPWGFTLPLYLPSSARYPSFGPMMDALHAALIRGYVPDVISSFSPNDEFDAILSMPPNDNCTSGGSYSWGGNPPTTDWYVCVSTGVMYDINWQNAGTFIFTNQEAQPPIVQPAPINDVVVTRTFSCPAGYTQGPNACYITTPSTTVLPDKSHKTGCDKCRPSTPDPVDIAMGFMWEKVDDIGATNGPRLQRNYNSQARVIGDVSNAPAEGFGYRWRTNYSRRVRYAATAVAIGAYVERPDGQILYFNKDTSTGAWSSDPDVHSTLTETDSNGSISGWTYFDEDTGDTETYDSGGNLIRIVHLGGRALTLSYNAQGDFSTVTDDFGRSLTFSYTSSSGTTYPGFVQSVKDSAGNTWTYTYNTTYKTLTQVTNPDGSAIVYHYENTNSPQLITGVSYVPAGGTKTRYSWFTYDTNNRVTQGYDGGNANQVALTYGSNGAVTVTYTLSTNQTQTRNYTFNVVQGMPKLAAVSGNCDSRCGPKSMAFDTNGNLTSETDFNGNVTNHSYSPDGAGLETQRVEAAGTTAQRTIQTDWNEALRLPVERRTLDATNNLVNRKDWVYDTTGAVLARCEIDPTNSAASGYACNASGTVPAGVRRWTYTYCTAVDTVQCPLVGLLLTATGPRTDLAQTTTYSYYLTSSAVDCGTPGAACSQPGDLHTVTDPLGHVTTIASYDTDGRVTRTTDANGINTDLTYTPRGWLASRTVGGAQTSFGYTPYGAVSSVTDPDGVATTYGYDAAHRLVKITDAQGNYLQYTLDAAGDKTAEQVYDASGTVHQSLSRTFNPLGQLTTVVDGLSHTVFNASATGSYDANGNLVQSSDGLGIQRQSSYDALNRLVQTIDNYNGTN